MENKEFDCVEMKHKAAQRIRKHIQNMNMIDRLAFWNRRFRKLKNKAAAIRNSDTQ